MHFILSMMPRAAPKDCLVVEQRGIPEEHLSQERVDWMIREVYVPIFNQHLRDGRKAVNFFPTHKEQIIRKFVQKISELPVSVKQHIPIPMELVFYMYERLRFIRWHDPSWLNIMPDVPITPHPFALPTSI